MNPRKISITDFLYDLPEEKIARFPIASRDASKLLYWNHGKISDRRFTDLPELLPEESLLVFNNSKVIQARMLLQTASGSKIELFLLEPANGTDPVPELQKTGHSDWRCMAGRASKWKDEILILKNNGLELSAKLLQRDQGTFIIRFSWLPANMAFSDILHHLGEVPLPPYLKRKPETSDLQRYQTIYAKQEGSVAAPTAGLHFTEATHLALAKRKIESAYVTLHVGAGTFKPVKAEHLEDHEMHSELIDVDINLIRKLLQFPPEKTTLVGTTALRSMESLYWLGVKLLREKDADTTIISQWYPYDHPAEDISYHSAVQAVHDHMNSLNLTHLSFKSSLVIVPGYKVRSCGGIVTNFHQPGSTLLLLVASLTGGHWLEIYNHALSSQYRFLSYGDSSYIHFR